MFLTSSHVFRWNVFDFRVLAVEISIRRPCIHLDVLIRFPSIFYRAAPMADRYRGVSSSPLAAYFLVEFYLFDFFFHVCLAHLCLT